MQVCGSSLFGSGFNYIKVGNGEFVAVEGSNIAERLPLSDLRMPYKQIIKGKVILKEGQSNYLLNHLGLGDNATFLAIKATYDTASQLEEDNYISYNYYDDLTNVYTFCQMLVLTGNSTNRVKQLYLSNPNTQYKVVLDVMIGVIDEEYSFFNDASINASTFVNLTVDSIKTHIQGESIVIVDYSQRPLVYITIDNIKSIQKQGKILVINDSSLGMIYLDFIDENEANQALSLFNYLLENPNIDLNSLNPIDDIEPPVIYFNQVVGGDGYGNYGYGYEILLEGVTYEGPYNTSQGSSFYTTIELASMGTEITISDLRGLLIDRVVDNRDGVIELEDSNLILRNESFEKIIIINRVGIYTLTFDLSDIATNSLEYVTVEINII